MKKDRFGKKSAVGLVVVCCVLFFGANAHFIYLASKTQPECIQHKKAGEGSDAGFSAAKSSC